MATRVRRTSAQGRTGSGTHDSNYEAFRARGQAAIELPLAVSELTVSPRLLYSELMEKSPAPEQDAASRAFRRVWFALSTVGFVLALGYSQIVHPWIVKRIEPAWRLETNDGYDEIARNLVDYRNYGLEPHTPTASRLPFYPLLLAALYRLSTANLTLFMQLAQAILHGATVGLVFWMGATLCGLRAGCSAAFFYALYPCALNYAARYQSEPLFTFLLTAFAFASVLAFQSPLVLSRTVLAGLLLGLTLLTRGTLVAFPVFLSGLSVSLRDKEAKRDLIKCLILAAVAAIVLVPWAVRNYARSGCFIPLSTWTWSPVYHGLGFGTHYLTELGNAEHVMERAGAEHQRALSTHGVAAGSERGIAGECYEDRVSGQLWLRRILADPFLFAWLVVRNLVLVWFVTYHTWSTAIMIGLHGPLVWLYARSFWDEGRARAPGMWVPKVLVVYFLLLHAILYPHVRYMVPVIPMLLVSVSPALGRVMNSFPDWLFGRAVGAKLGRDVRWTGDRR